MLAFLFLACLAFGIGLGLVLGELLTTSSRMRDWPKANFYIGRELRIKGVGKTRIIQINRRRQCVTLEVIGGARDGEAFEVPNERCRR